MGELFFVIDENGKRMHDEPLKGVEIAHVMVDDMIGGWDLDGSKTWISKTADRDLNRPSNVQLQMEINNE